MGIRIGTFLRMKPGGMTHTANRLAQRTIRSQGGLVGKLTRAGTRTRASFGGKGAFVGRGRGWRRFLPRGRQSLQQLGLSRGVVQAIHAGWQRRKASKALDGIFAQLRSTMQRHNAKWMN